ncbi:uncharacterized protein LOC118467676 [Anopheles albimanus]|uniref:Uncharacterized protein n=1 Tax=Anopheles albimanus TaxID=7167 RepID=A0A182FVJ0_ANOAL|nr:uncharacterized protein LOC118467676 [Anopheles albimanus]
MTNRCSTPPVQDPEDIDEETLALIADSVQLADELDSITVHEEVQRSHSIILKELEADVEQYARATESYKQSLDELALLENGVLHTLNRVAAVPANVVGLAEKLEGKLKDLRGLLRETITTVCPSMLAQEGFAALGSHREQLEAMEQRLEQMMRLIDAGEVHELVKLMEPMQRVTKNLRLELDSALKLNVLHQQMIMGFSNKIFHDSPPPDK